MTEKKNNRLQIRNSTVDLQKAIAKAFAESEFEQYRIIQDPLYQSSFGRLVANTKEED